MTIEDFIDKFAFAIEVDTNALAPDTHFKTLPSWDSLNTLAVIAMADADYGYVGAGRGKISLYKKKECIEKNIPEEEAVEKLIELIKSNGDYAERT